MVVSFAVIVLLDIDYANPSGFDIALMILAPLNILGVVVNLVVGRMARD